MAYRIIWSPSARLDLREIAEYISEDNPVAARKFVQQVFQLIERLPLFPDSGRVVPEFADPRLREIIRLPCRIIYRINRDLARIEILRIWHAKRGTPIL